MRTIYKWEVIVVVWEDGQCLKRKFSAVAQDVTKLLESIKHMDDCFDSMKVERIECKGRWMGGSR